MSHGEYHFKNRDKIVYFKAFFVQVLKFEPPSVRFRQPILWPFAKQNGKQCILFYFTKQRFHKIG